MLRLSSPSFLSIPYFSFYSQCPRHFLSCMDFISFVQLKLCGAHSRQTQTQLILLSSCLLEQLITYYYCFPSNLALHTKPEQSFSNANEKMLSPSLKTHKCSTYCCEISSRNLRVACKTLVALLSTHLLKVGSRGFPCRLPMHGPPSAPQKEEPLFLT